jgi:hypothetical protein
LRFYSSRKRSTIVGTVNADRFWTASKEFDNDVTNARFSSPHRNYC